MVIRAGLKEIAGVIDAVRAEGDLGNRTFEGVSIDSRTISEGNLFIAIEGKREDGHRYISQAASRGASAIVANARYKTGGIDSGTRLLVVDDTLTAMHKLASWWLSRCTPVSVAVTGTNGKTTTKEMIAAVLATTYGTCKSPGNLNNLYGVPLAIFAMDDSYEVAVMEFGMSTPGEIAALTKLVQPRYGVITNIEAAHLETMLTVDAIASAKFELLDNMPADGTVILNLDNAYLRRRFDIEKLAKLGFGVRESCDIYPDRFEIDGSGCTRFHTDSTGEVRLALPGLHNMYNALAAIAVGHLMNVPGRMMKAALESFAPIEMRMETVIAGNVTIINDTYNANPVSMMFGLDTLASIRSSGRRIAVLGDMLELGQRAMDFHREVGAYAASTMPDFIVTSGVLAECIAAGASKAGYPSDRLRHIPDVAGVIDYLLDYLRPGDVILIKASRSMAFDTITLGLRSQLGRDN